MDQTDRIEAAFSEADAALARGDDLRVLDRVYEIWNAGPSPSLLPRLQVLIGELRPSIGGRAGKELDLLIDSVTRSIASASNAGTLVRREGASQGEFTLAAFLAGTGNQSPGVRAQAAQLFEAAPAEQPRLLLKVRAAGTQIPVLLALTPTKLIRIRLEPGDSNVPPVGAVALASLSGAVDEARLTVTLSDETGTFAFDSAQPHTHLRWLAALLATPPDRREDALTAPSWGPSPFSDPVARFGPLRLYPDALAADEGWWRQLSSEVKTTIDTSGNVAVTQQRSAGRAIAGGVLFGAAGAIVGSASTKSTVHDFRDVYLAIEAPDWFYLARGKAADEPAIRAFASSVELVARRCGPASTHGSEVEAAELGRGPAPIDPYERLRRLAQLRDEGILTDEEFGEQKARILADGL